jgi:hypothetical protein
MGTIYKPYRDDLKTQKKFKEMRNSNYTVSMNTPTKANSKHSSYINKSYDKMNNSRAKQLNMAKQLNNSVFRKIEYPKHLLPYKADVSCGKLDPVVIEDRFTRIVKQPHK